jgi:hypothetical protein
MDRASIRLPSKPHHLNFELVLGYLGLHLLCAYIERHGVVVQFHRLCGFRSSWQALLSFVSCFALLLPTRHVCRSFPASSLAFSPPSPSHFAVVVFSLFTYFVFPRPNIQSTKHTREGDLKSTRRGVWIRRFIRDQCRFSGFDVSDPDMLEYLPCPATWAPRPAARSSGQQHDGSEQHRRARSRVGACDRHSTRWDLAYQLGTAVAANIVNFGNVSGREQAESASSKE